MKKRIVFMGSPDFSLPSLVALSEKHEVVGVVTQPDRPAGRGKVMTPPPVKLLAETKSIPFIQPNRLKDVGVFEQLTDWAPDLIVVVAFGQILRQKVLDFPKYGCINVHGSLLPRWRGAAPMQAAILYGDRLSGVTIMKMDAGIDTGDILSQQAIVLDGDETTETLSGKLAQLGADLLLETLDSYLNRKLLPKRQDDALATYAPQIKKEDGLLDPKKSAKELERQVRAFTPWPGSFLNVEKERIKILSTEVKPDLDLAAGERTILDGYPVLMTTKGALLITKLQPAGKKPMSGKDFLLGFKKW